MNPDSSPGAALKQILDQHGQQLAFDADATLPLLSQACPNAPREVEAIVAAQRLRIPWELLNMGAGADPARLDELAETLANGTGMPLDASRWIIQTWMNALDIKVQATVSESEAQEPGVPEAAEPSAVVSATEAAEPAAVAAPPEPGPAPVAQPAATAASPARYFVLGQGGAKYGPADVATLNQWAAEGRIAPGTLFEEEGTGRTVHGHEVAGLFMGQRGEHFPPGSYAGPGPYGQAPTAPGLRPEQNPYGQAPQGPYYQPGVDTSSLKGLYTWSIVFTVLGMLFFCCIGLFGLIFTILGSSDMKAGNLQGAKSKLTVALVIGIVSVCIGLVTIPLRIAQVEQALSQRPPMQTITIP